MRAVQERCPAAASALESEPLDEYQFHRLGRMTGDDTCLVFDEAILAILAIVGVSKIEHRIYSTHGKTFQKRSHQVRVMSCVSFSLQVRYLVCAS